MASNLDWDKIKEIRLLPRHGCFYVEYVYQRESTLGKTQELDPEKVLAIDHRLDNWLTCVTNVGTSFIVDGKHLKSVNQWYNKQIATIKEGKPQGFWSKRLASQTEKRNRQMRDAVNKAARLVINYCVLNGIGRIVFGWNKGQKDSINIGAKNNQKFAQVPTAKLKERIKELCAFQEIQFIETEESYTSQASFLDGDIIPVYGEKPDNWKGSGQRIKRGLYRPGNHAPINADANGAANILRKVAATLGLCLKGVSSGALTTPVRVHFWTTCESPDLMSGEGQSNIILQPTNLWLTIHESVGHPTELDRVYGYEANFAGTSFATTEKLGKLQYGAPWINLVADRTQPGGRGTTGYDDEGVKAQRWYVVKEGILVDYLTDRETAYRLGRGSSNGSAYADNWASPPMVRIPNLGLEPGVPGGSHTATLEEMIADTEEGILIDGMGSFSIDQQRRNFQFGGDAFWQVKKGKVVGMLKNVTYHSNTIDFWNSVDAIGPRTELQQCGTNMCGKGEPMQIAQMTHGCVPVRVRDIKIGLSS